ncbi:biotin transporter BioY [Coprobacillaceae bacterium CR2/5/TPMF4]|nr:biotin transporter BioY [Coprobacillaceae bacterium CR2/5/TPMF4]
MIFGLLVCYLFGTIWFMIVYARSTGTIGVWTALTWCVIPYIIPDGIKIGLAFVLSMRLKRISKLN